MDREKARKMMSGGSLSRSCNTGREIMYKIEDERQDLVYLKITNTRPLFYVHGKEPGEKES